MSNSPATPPFAAVLRALELIESAHDSDGPLQTEARWCLAERRRPRPILGEDGLPAPLAAALASARADAAAAVLARADAALWAAAGRCSRGWELNVGWQRVDAELTDAERRDACVTGRKGRRLQTAWRDAKRRGRV